jgi:hypothetical protein
MKNIHILPTDQPSRLHLWTDENGMRLALCELEYSHTRNTQNLYITSSEEIIEGVNQWYLDKFLNKPMNSGGAQYGEKQNIITLTTDQTLIADGVQSINDEFLKWFVKNPTCEFVEVKSDWKLLGNDYEHNGYATLVYKIIIPQEEPKHSKVSSENGNELSFDKQGNLIKETVGEKVMPLDNENIPEEKAKELFLKFRQIPPSSPYTGVDDGEAKQCSLIAVDEIIKENDMFDRTDGYVQQRIDYWNEVKQEIEKLW